MVQSGERSSGGYVVKGHRAYKREVRQGPSGIAGPQWRSPCFIAVVKVA